MSISSKIKLGSKEYAEQLEKRREASADRIAQFEHLVLLNNPVKRKTK